MKNMVVILVQPRWTLLKQNFSLSKSRRDYVSFVDKLTNRLYAEGKRFNFSKPLLNQEVVDWLSDKYIELRGYYRIRMDYKEFEAYMLAQKELPNSYTFFLRYGYGAFGCPYRYGRSYVRNTDHEPKNRPTKDAWREHKRIKKDKSKQCAHYRGECKRFWKKRAAREHRAWVRDVIYKENWDLFSDIEYKQFADPWRWN